MNPVTVTTGSRIPKPALAMFGSLLRSLRGQGGFTQRSLGAAMFFSREYIALVERGVRAPSTTFVERAETALNADGKLQHAYSAIKQSAGRDVIRRPIVGRRSKIAIAARRFCSITRQVPVDDVPAAWLTAVDDLHRVLRDELHPIVVDDHIIALEQRCEDLAAAAGDTVIWADVVTSATLGTADAGALLQQPLRSDDFARAGAVASAFAALAADALLMLGFSDRAAEWYQLADLGQHRMPESGEMDEPAAHAAPELPDLEKLVVEACRESMLPRRPGPGWRSRPPTHKTTRPTRQGATQLHARSIRSSRWGGRAPPNIGL